MSASAKVFPDTSAEYAAFVKLIKAGEVDTRRRAILRNVGRGQVYYHYTHDDGNVYELSFQFCRCGELNCLSAPHECALEDFSFE